MIQKIISYFFHPSNFIIFFASRNILKISDETYLKILYKNRMQKELNLENPQTFNEKLQWLKLHDRKEKYSIMVDKYEVKKYVSKLIGDEYIIPTLGVYNNFDEINFDELPKQFVLKCTHDSGGNIVCRDKEKLDFLKFKRKINNYLKKNFYYLGREWPYKNVKKRIIVEKYMFDEKQKEGLIDYKFYCFNGEPKFLYISKGLENHETAKISFLNIDYTLAPFQREDFSHFKELPQKPKKYDKMLEIVKILSKNIAFVRVDLYEINDKIYFSEFTFTPCGGLMKFIPLKYDRIVGDMLNIENEEKER